VSVQEVEKSGKESTAGSSNAKCSVGKQLWQKNSERSHIHYNSTRHSPNEPIINCGTQSL